MTRYTPRDLIFRMENQIGVCEPEANQPATSSGRVDNHILNTQNVSHQKGVKKSSKTIMFPFLKGLTALSLFQRGVYLYPLGLSSSQAGSPPAHNILNAYGGLCKHGKPNYVQYI